VSIVEISARPTATVPPVISGYPRASRPCANDPPAQAAQLRGPHPRRALPLRAGSPPLRCMVWNSAGLRDFRLAPREVRKARRSCHPACQAICSSSNRISALRPCLPFACWHRCERASSTHREKSRWPTPHFLRSIFRRLRCAVSSPASPLRHHGRFSAARIFRWPARDFCGRPSTCKLRSRESRSKSISVSSTLRTTLLPEASAIA